MNLKAKEEEEIKTAHPQVSGLTSWMEGSTIYWTGDNLGRNGYRGWVVIKVCFEHGNFEMSVKLPSRYV